MNSFDNRFLSDYNYENVIEHAKSVEINDKKDISNNLNNDNLEKWDSRFWSNSEYEHKSQNAISWTNIDDKEFKISINKYE